MDSTNANIPPGSGGLDCGGNKMSNLEKCPVCDGRGQVPASFYDIPDPMITAMPFTFPVMCRACSGAGYILPTSACTVLPPVPEVVPPWAKDLAAAVETTVNQHKTFGMTTGFISGEVWGCICDICTAYRAIPAEAGEETP